MENKQIADELRKLVEEVRKNQLKCNPNGLNIIRLKMALDHLEDAIDILDVQQPWA